MPTHPVNTNMNDMVAYGSDMRHLFVTENIQVLSGWSLFSCCYYVYTVLRFSSLWGSL